MKTTENYYQPFIKSVLKDNKQTDFLFGLFKIGEKQVETNFPVDLVYLWVDSNDKVWQEKKNSYKKNWSDKENQEQACGDGRFADNDELKFSLRSVEKFAPWINRIFIITDNQIPKWLDTTNPKIKVVFHEDFIPKENLPLFNSEAIETYFPEIPELSEHFIYANDDVFISKPVDKFFFYDFSGNPVVRLKHQVSKKQAKVSMYNRTILHTQQLIKEKFGKKYRYAPHHNMDSYRKSDFTECKNLFKKEFETTGLHKFRTEGDIQRIAVLYYVLCKGHGKLKLYSRVDRYLPPLKRIINNLAGRYSADSVVFNANDRNINKKIAKYNPKLFCINDGEGISDSDRARISKLLAELYPEKSSFELQD